MSARRPRVSVVLLAVVSALVPACSETPPLQAPVAQAPATPNQTLLDEVNAAEGWTHVRKTRPIWARRVEADQTIQTIEGTETVRAGDYICRGEAGDVWPQSARDLERKYLPTDEIDDDGWHRFDPHPDAEGALAAQIAHPFTVEAKWGRLTGKAGDYLLKNFADADASYPADVWIVDQTLFDATYEPVDGP